MCCLCSSYVLQVETFQLDHCFLLSGATTLCHHASSRCHRQTSQENNSLQLVVMPGTNTVTEGSWWSESGFRKGPLCLSEQCHSVPPCLTHRGVGVELALPLIYEPSPRGRAAIALHLTVFKLPHQHADNQQDKEERPAQGRGVEGVDKGADRKKGRDVYKLGLMGVCHPMVCQCLITTCL